MTELDVLLDKPRFNIDNANNLLSDLGDLYASFHPLGSIFGKKELVRFAETSLDFRDGRPREDTPWSEGSALSAASKQATLQIANRWGMLRTSFPAKPFDRIVVLGAHKDPLQIRAAHALDIQANYAPDSELIMLSCFRSIHPKEGVDQPEIETEADLAISILEKELSTDFRLEAASSWQDLPHKAEQTEENAVALVGKVGLMNAVVLSGSVPENSERASTVSTLETLRSYLEESRPRLLFVTTSLHLPYQSMQIEQIMQGFEHQTVGVAYRSLEGMSLDSADVKFRVILQEIGATIKNGLRNEI